MINAQLKYLIGITEKSFNSQSINKRSMRNIGDKFIIRTNKHLVFKHRKRYQRKLRKAA